MNGIVVEGGKGPATALKLQSLPAPSPGPGQILIRVRAAGVNRPDLFQRMGLYPPPAGASATLGLEVAGEVARAAGRWSVGDRICALLPGGGYAEYAVCDSRHALPIPSGLDFHEAATLPEAVFTVYANVFELGGLQAGQTLLVHGATSGIGATAVQMAKAAGARVIATVRGAVKAAAALTLGADIAVDASAADFGEIAEKAGGVDVALDMVGGDYLAKNLRAMKPSGRIVFIASLGATHAALPVMLLIQKQIKITGSTLRDRDANEKARLAGRIEHVVWPWIAAGQVQPVIDRQFALADASAAHARLEGGSHIGKVVLTMS